MGHIERRIREKEEVRQSILDAAIKIAGKDGWHSVTIRKIADEIQYTPPIVYEHFENKDDLIRELIYMGFHKLNQEIIKVKDSESDSRKLLLIISGIHWDFAFANLELYQLMFSPERPTPNEEIIFNLTFIKDLFLNLAKGDVELMHELIFNWICLNEGAIGLTMKIAPPPEFANVDPRELFLKLIVRFINSVE